MIVLLLPFSLDSFHFFFFSAVAMTSKSMLKNSGESKHPCLVPDLIGTGFSFSPLRDVSCGFVIYGLYCVEVI